MAIIKDFDEIYDHAHMWNWGPDWIIVKDIYQISRFLFSIDSICLYISRRVNSFNNI